MMVTAELKRFVEANLRHEVDIERTHDHACSGLRAHVRGRNYDTIILRYSTTLYI